MGCGRDAGDRRLVYQPAALRVGVLLSVVLLGAWAWARWCLINLQVERTDSVTLALSGAKR